MPVQVIYRYTCPITGSVVDCEDLGSHPDGWFTLNGDSYAPQAQGVIAQRIGRGITAPSELTAPMGTVADD